MHHVFGVLFLLQEDFFGSTIDFLRVGWKLVVQSQPVRSRKLFIVRAMETE
jgi:nitrogen fixation protein